MSSVFVIIATRIICFVAIVSLVLLLLGSINLILLYILIVSRAYRHAFSINVNRGERFLYASKGLSAGDLEKLHYFEFSTPRRVAPPWIVLSAWRVSSWEFAAGSCQFSIIAFMLVVWILG